MKSATVFALLLAVTGLCLAAYAADDASTTSEERKSQIDISYDAAALTARVLEAFPDGLPFDQTGRATDEEKATQFWQLIADSPITFKSRAVTPGSAAHVVAAVAGLPLFFTPTAMEEFKKGEATKQDVESAGSVEDALIAIGGLVGAERAVVAPIGIILATPDDPEQITEVVTIPPQPVFLWRADFGALVKEAFPDGFTMETASDEDKKELVRIATSIRCDLVVPGQGKLEDFVRWIAHASGQPISIDEAVYRQILASGKMVGPVSMRFAPFLDALNAALEPAGFVATEEETRFQIIRAEPAEEAKENEDE